jgi:hypothetical protein
MRPLDRSLLINGIVSTALIFISFAAPGVWLLFFGVCLVQLVLGLILLVNQQSRPIGQGMLIIGGLCLLVGFSVCTLMFNS